MGIFKFHNISIDNLLITQPKSDLVLTFLIRKFVYNYEYLEKSSVGPEMDKPKFSNLISNL